MFTASIGPGDKDSKGLIVPRFGNQPENHVAVSMTFELLSELLLMTKTHYEAWLTGWYLSQTQFHQHQNQQTRAASDNSAESNVSAQQLSSEYPGQRMF